MPLVADAASSPFVAIGVLSSAIQFETNRASTSKLRLLRDKWRGAASRFANTAVGRSVVYRFVLAPPPPAHDNDKRRAIYWRDYAAAEAEAATHGDMIFLSNMTESFYLCAWKKILWYRYATVHFPSARFYLIADSDTYVQLAHLDADLRNTQSLIGSGLATPHVYYGLVLWKPFFNRVTLEPAGDLFHAGWLYTDERAAHLRARLEDCRSYRLASGAIRNASGADAAADAAVASAAARAQTAAPYDHILMPACLSTTCVKRCDSGKPCRAMCAWKRPKELLSIDRMDSTPPYPFAAGPLFGLSRSLALALANDDAPVRWKVDIERTEVLRFYAKHGRVPFVLRNAACYPQSFDATHGRWVWEVARSRNLTVSLVNTPFQIQHHPWVAYRHGAFSNASIVLHELKNPKSPGWAFAENAGRGPFVPYHRQCGECEAIGWSTVPNNMVGRWRCCGDAGGKVRAGAAWACKRQRTLCAFEK